MGQGMRGGHAGEVVGERGMVWAFMMRSSCAGEPPRRGGASGWAWAGDRVQRVCGLPEAARFAAPGRRLLTQAWPPASLPAPSQTQTRIPISTPTSANGGCTPKAGTCLQLSLQPLSASGWKCRADLCPAIKWHSSPTHCKPKPRTSKGRFPRAPSTTLVSPPAKHPAFWSRHEPALFPTSGPLPSCPLSISYSSQPAGPGYLCCVPMPHSSQGGDIDMSNGFPAPSKGEQLS